MGNAWPRMRALGLALVLTGMGPCAALAASPTSKPSGPPENTYWVSFFAPVFDAKAGEPTSSAALQATLTEIVGDAEVELGQSPNGYIAPSADVPTTYRRVSDLNVEGMVQYSEGAILAVDKGIVRALNAKGYGAVLVVPSPNDIDPRTLNDTRPRRKGTLHLLISVPTAAEIRTIASGNRLSSSSPRINNSKQERIIHNSPIQAASQSSDPTASFFNEELVNDYVDRLNRQPGRRVDVALSAADAPDQYTLDYLVNEMKAWYAYAQVSNTGPVTTSTWRYRFGIVDNQLTGNDDIFNFDVVTDLNQSTNVVGSYEFPIGANDPALGTDRLRARVYGTWDQYTAADLGFPGDNFNGNDYSAGAEVTYNAYQRHSLFVDVIAGARYQSSQVKSSFQQTTASADYLVPYVGARVQDYRETYSYVGAMNLEGGITSANKESLAALGRPNPDQDWFVAQPSAQGSFYLEPLLDPAGFTAGRSTLANEIYVSGRAQYSFNYRLIPQFEQTAGGFNTVRGYPEAETAGDSLVVVTGEYRFHLPRFLGVQPNPSSFNLFGDPFRLTPQAPYQRPDWDLIFRGFLDIGQVIQSRAITGEFNDTLVGTGFGAEFQIKQNVDIRGDWGVALTNLSNRVKTGSNRFTVIVTLLY